MNGTMSKRERRVKPKDESLKISSPNCRVVDENQLNHHLPEARADQGEEKCTRKIVLLERQGERR